MAKRSKSQRPKKAPAPAAEAAARIAPRRKTADRRLRILERLTTGLSVAHIARAEQLSVQRMRQIIAEMLASREIDPPAGFVQFQIARLSEAMIVARTMMMEGNLQAMDRWIKLMGELDRYHGFAPAQIPAAPDGRRRRASPGRSAARSRRIPPSAKSKGNFPPRKPLKFLETRKKSRTRRQRLAAPERRPIPPNPARGEVEGKFSASQTLEIPQNAEGILGAAAAGPRRARAPLDPRRIRPAERTEAFRSPASRRERLTETESPGNGAATA